MDKTKIFEAAGKFASKGQLDKAAKEYQRVLDEDPKDVRALQKLAEIHQKNGKNKEAADLMLRVAEGYGEQGFFLKAVAVYKQVLKIGPERIDVNLKLAQLYQQLGLVGDATQQYQLVANHYDKAGNVKESLAALRKMVDLDPDNVASRVKLGELYARERMNAEAVTELKRAASYLKKNNRTDDHLRVVERIGQLVPDDVPVAKELAQAFLSKGDTKRALAKLQVCFRQNPKDVETLTLLARAFQELGQDQKTISVYRELAHVHAELNQTDAQIRVVERLLELAPGDPEATQTLADLQGRRASAPGPVAPPAPSVITPPAPSVIAPPPPPQRAVPAPAANVPAFRPTTPVAPPSGTSPAIAKLLTETDVYLKYGLVAKAAEHVQKALREEPQSLAAHEKLLAILDKQGKTDEAVQAVAQLVELSRAAGDADRNRIYTQELGQRAPGHPLVTAAAAAADLGGADDLVVEADAADLVAADLAADAAQDEVVAGEEVFEEINTEPTQPPPAPYIQSRRATPGPMPAGPAPWDTPLAPEDDEVVVDPEAIAAGATRADGLDLDANELDATFGRQQPARVDPPEALDPFALLKGDDGDEDDDAVVVLEDEVHEEHAPEAAPPSGQELDAAHDAAQAGVEAVGEDVLAEPQALEVPTEEPDGASFDEQPAEATAEALEGSDGFSAAGDGSEPADDDLFAEEVAEADFLIQQGLLDDARYALEAILAQAPDHARANELFRRFEQEPAAAPVGPPPESEDSAPGSELADELDGAFAAAQDPGTEAAPRDGGEGQYSVGDVLSEFKVKLSQTIGVEDSQTHYDLGIAYKEMGLYDEAIHEFEVAMSGTGQRRVVDCVTMIGVCRLEKGQPQEAIEAFARALKTPGLTLEASKEAHYEIGRCRELLGDERAAYDHYARVHKADPTFRDVGVRVAKLKPRVGAAPAPARPNGAPVPAVGRASMPAPARPKATEPAPDPPSQPRSGRKIGFV